MESHLSWYVKKVSDQKKKSDKDQCMLGAHAVTSGNSSESNLKKVAWKRSVLYDTRKKARNIQYCKI